MSKTSAFVLLACLAMTGSVMAAPAIYITRIPGHYLGDGGEFNLQPNDDFTALTGETAAFASFCLERSEAIYVGRNYSVILNDEAILGGTNRGTAGSEGGDPLDPRTAYLYSHFRAGTLAGYAYAGPDHAASAGALQQVIWFLEDELGTTAPWSVDSLQATFYQTADTAVTSGAWTGLGNVRVLNMYVAGHAGDPQYHRQDMLVTAVPAPGAILLGALGTGVVGLLRRRHMM